MQSVSSAAFIVHNLGDAKRALEIAKRAGQNVTLLSPPSAASLLGPKVFNEMILAAVAQTGSQKLSINAVIDCGATPGPALRAIRDGCAHIQSSASSDVFAKIKDIAAASGATASNEPIDAIDLGDCNLDDAGLLAWVSSNGTSHHV